MRELGIMSDSRQESSQEFAANITEARRCRAAWASFSGASLSRMRGIVAGYKLDIVSTLVLVETQHFRDASTSACL